MNLDVDLLELGVANMPDDEGPALASIAISLKRIAAITPTLRDQFAMAMAPALFTAAHDKPNAWGPQIIAEQAYQFANAMMEARGVKL